MDLANLERGLREGKYECQNLDDDGSNVTVTFKDPADALRFARSLLVFFIPRKYANNLINGTVSFETRHLDRITQLLLIGVL